jgi:hypothetical protein
MQVSEQGSNNRPMCPKDRRSMQWPKKEMPWKASVSGTAARRYEALAIQIVGLPPTGKVSASGTASPAEKILILESKSA